MTRTALAPTGGRRMAAKAPKCSRCRRRLRNSKLLDARAMIKSGLVDVDALVCRGCLTDHEYFAMEARGAMFDPVISGGRIKLVPKFTLQQEHTHETD